MSITKRLLTTMISAMLISFCAFPWLACQNAFAAELTTGASSTPKVGNVTAQALKGAKSIYVISSLTIKSSASNSTETYKYVYNNNGLLSNRTSSGNVIDKFGYKSKKLVSEWHAGEFEASSDIKYTYKNGKPVKSYDSASKYIKTFNYNKKGLISKVTTKAPQTKPYTFTYEYNGLGKIISGKYSTWKNTAYELEYDSNNLPKTVKQYWTDDHSNCNVSKYSNTYKNRRLMKVVETQEGGYTVSYAITYKKVKAPTNFAATVEKQQKDLILHAFTPVAFIYGLPIGYY